MTLSLGPPFILKFFFIFKCWLYTKERQLRLKKNSFLIKVDEKKKKKFDEKKIYCTTFITMTTKIKAKSKLRMKLVEKKSFKLYLLSMYVICCHMLISPLAHHNGKNCFSSP